MSCDSLQPLLRVEERISHPYSGRFMSNTPEGEHFWVFGYGSLMWNPGFDHVEVQKATMNGVHRAPCVYSWRHRGTKSRPGIVLGLDQGGRCTGKAFKVKTEIHAPVLAYLRERELITNVYLETHYDAVLESGETISTLTYMVDQNHPQYAGKLSHQKLLKQIKGAVGKSGPNEAYFLNTAEHLAEIGIRDETMERLAKDLNPL